jgi:hypothetical protein
MHYQSHELGKSLLAPLTAVFQDVQKQLQMELDVEQLSIESSLSKSSPTPNKTQLIEISKINPEIETHTMTNRLQAELSSTHNEVKLTTTINKTSTNSIVSTLLVSAAYQPINLESSQKLFKPSMPDKPLKTKKLENSVSTTLLQINPTIGHSSRLPLTAMIGEILGQTVITTDTVLLNDTKKAMPETGEFKPTKAINHAGAQQLFAFSTHNSSVKNSAVSTTLSSNKLAVGLPITPIDKETGQSVMVTPSTAKKVFTEHSAQASSNDVTAKQKTAVLLPLRKQTTANASTQASQKISPILPSAIANRLEAAVEPALQQAYQVTQQQLQSITQDSSEERSSELVRNTFNVAVAMNNNSGSDSIDLSDFEQALTEVLRIAARRQGLEV